MIEWVHKVKEYCEWRDKSSITCDFYDITIRSDGALIIPTYADRHCILFDDADDDDGSVGKDVGST